MVSLSDDKYYFIQKPLDFFLENTNARMIPIAVDSGGNYYCVDNETGKVYFWFHETEFDDEDAFDYTAESVESFAALFEG